MFDQARHVSLRQLTWREDIVRTAIDEIVADALAHFDPVRFWPVHPLDEQISDSHASLYFGATGVVWALDYLRRVGATDAAIDFAPVLTHLMKTTQRQFARMQYSAHGSLLFGDMGTALVVMRISPDPAVADLIEQRAAANTMLPVRELMWGMPGSMLACVHMTAMTGEARWRSLFDAQAMRLMDELEETSDGPLWTQDLYGKHQKWLGPVHGFAGNMIPLLRGWDWLSAAQRDRVADVIQRTLRGTAELTGLGANWSSMVASGWRSNLCQHCHGAPGMVTTFADAPFSSAELDTLLLKGGQFAWAAGPLAKGSNLCHGTGGNGYAFLKLHRRTGDPIWLERARAFAMTSIAQCREARSELGRGRFSLWTGDVGLAIYLWDCLSGVPRFPTIDVF